MSDLNPFVAKYGISQGRIKPRFYTPTDGEYVFVLGSEDPDMYDMKVGDYVEVHQDLDMTGINLIRLDTGFIQPESMPDRRDISTGSILKRDDVINTGDDLSAIITTATNPLSQADEGLQLEITGAINAGNNKVNRILSVVGTSVGILEEQVLNEATGFTAIIRGARWEASMIIGGVELFTVILRKGSILASSDVAGNVSKLTGNHTVYLRLALIGLF